jgi:vancomycin permeability regulator SanA
MRIFSRRWRRIALILLVSAITGPPALVAYVTVITSNQRYTDPTAVPTEPVALVFGAGVRQDGTPSPMLADRVQTAVQLYELGRVRKILMTGDNSQVEYNEVAAMQRYAVDRGVPTSDITLDYAGFSTYESCYRARVIFGVERAVLITQQFHLPRAVYTCRQLGIEAIGLGTPDWEAYSSNVVRFYTAREFLATLKALWQIHITRPLPTFLGPYEGIT